MPINRTIFKISSWGIIPTPNVINFIYLESLLKVASNLHHGWEIWKTLKKTNANGKGLIAIRVWIPFLSFFSKFLFGSHFS